MRQRSVKKKKKTPLLNCKITLNHDNLRLISRPHFFSIPIQLNIPRFCRLFAYFSKMSIVIQ